MNPEAGDILNRSADQIAAQLLPALGANYAQGTAALLSLLMKFAAREYERGADIRAKENADIRRLFGELAPRLSDAALAARLERLAQSRDDSLAISALNAANAGLRRALIDVQAHVEVIGDADAERAIWRVLKAMAERRLVSLF